MQHTNIILPNLYLKIESKDEDIIKYYKNACVSSINNTAKSNSGFDLIISQDYNFDITKPSTIILDTGISSATEYGGYDLVPRSSIYKYPIRLANSVGIIDNGYRGIIGAVIDFRPELIQSLNINKDEKIYTLKKGTKLFQLVHGTRLPFIVSEVDKLSESERGILGFGSSGTT